MAEILDKDQGSIRLMISVFILLFGSRGVCTEKGPDRDNSQKRDDIHLPVRWPSTGGYSSNTEGSKKDVNKTGKSADECFIREHCLVCVEVVFVVLKGTIVLDTL